MMQPGEKKIVVVCYTGNSGLTDYSVSLSRALSVCADVTLVTGRNVPDEYLGFPFKVNKFFRKSRYYPFDVIRLLWFFVRNRPDAVLFQSWLKIPLVDTILVSLLRVLGIRTAVTVHDVLPHYPRSWSQLELAAYYRMFDKVVVHSDKAKAKIISMGVTSPILVVPHGIYDLFDTERLGKQQGRSRIGGLNAEDFVILFFGRITPRKGVITFLRVAEAYRNDANVKFVVAGFDGMKDADSDERDEYLRLCNAENVILADRRIPFLEVQWYFSATDLVVLPYTEGTTSGVIKLALAFKKPVVATNIGDIADALSLGFGELVELGSDVESEIGMAIEKIRRNPAYYRTHADNAFEKYEWGGIAKQYYLHIV